METICKPHRGPRHGEHFKIMWYSGKAKPLCYVFFLSLKTFFELLAFKKFVLDKGGRPGLHWLVCFLGTLSEILIYIYVMYNCALSRESDI
jgi:hypothetical protein